MTAYNVTTNFGSKDDLASGNTAKKIKGSEFTTEFNNIATGVNSKADTTTVNTTTATANAALPKAGGTVTGNVILNDNVKALFGTGSCKGSHFCYRSNRNRCCKFVYSFARSAFC